jgi:hypothetical protein
MPLPSLSRSFQLFKEGLDKLLWAYWLAFKEEAWEIFWGPTLLGIVFGIGTLWYSPARMWFIAYVLVVVFLTGYYLWRDNHIRLEQKLEITRVHTQEWMIPQGSANAGHLARAYYFEVLNLSEGATIESVSVQLKSMIPGVSNLDWLPIHLRLKHDNPTDGKSFSRSFDLNPREPRNIDFVAALEGDNRFSISHVAGWANDKVPFDTDGNRLQVMVTAKHTPILLVWFKVWRNEFGLIQCEIEHNGRSRTTG